MNTHIQVDGHTIDLSHVDKILFPESGITKGDLINYYQKIAPFLLPHIKDHLMVMHRYPNGITHEGFYQKEEPSFFPSWIHHVTVELRKGGKQNLIVLDKAADLVFLANQAVVVLHSWMSTCKKPDYPNKIVFDLDPAANNDVEQLHFTAKAVKALLEDHKLIPFVMTTGSRGFHVVAPIKVEHQFSTVHNFTKQIAHELAQKYPDLMTVEMSIAERKNKIFIDYLRNTYGATSVAPYSVRAHPHAPVATPLDWDELHTTDSQHYKMDTIFKRLSHKEDPWKTFEKQAKPLKI